MESFEIRPASRVHCTQLAPRLRPCDMLEIYRASGNEPLEALLKSIRVSDEGMVWTAFLRGHPVAMFGCNELYPDDTGIAGGIWLLASDGIYENKLDFMRKCKEYLDIMHEKYEFLTNFIDADNMPTQRWLPVLGFKPVAQVDKFGFGGTPFVQYMSKRN